MTQPIELLKQLLSDGKINEAEFRLLAGPSGTATVAGDGALAQGENSVAVSPGGVAVLGDNNGLINLGTLIQQASEPGASPAVLRRTYLVRMLKQADQLPLFAGDHANAQVRLSSVYTALLTNRADEDFSQRHRSSPERDAKRLSALEVLNAERQLVLLGGPGSGKSTFVNFVALAMAGELLCSTTANLESLTAPLPKEAGAKQAPQPQRWDHGALIPVHIILRDLAAQLPPPGTPANAQTVWAFITHQLEQASLGRFAPELQKEMLERGALVLFDGLDEVPDANNRRVQIKQAVQDFVATYSRCRYLVTSRTYAYQNQDWKLQHFAEVQLAPFTNGQIERFVDVWYAHMVQLVRLSAPVAAQRAEVLKREAQRKPRIRELAERPLLLTLVARLQTEAGGTLPEKREEIYDKAVEMLLNEWEKLKSNHLKQALEPSLSEWLQADRADIRKQLNRLAFEAHRDQQNLTGTADIRQESLIAALMAASKRSDENPALLARYLRDRAGILAAHGNDLYQFPHRSFQEYLAACHLTEDEFPDKLAELARHDPNRWREVTLLAAAKAARGAPEFSTWALAAALCESPVPEGAAREAEHWGALLAGQVLVECANLQKVSKSNAPVLARICDWQLAIMRRNTLPAVERALAGRTLATLGDPRPEVMTLNGMQFCFVPAGPFQIGESKQTKVFDLKYSFFIARFPLSTAQWREFIQESNQIPSDDRSLQGRKNDPAVRVSWRDAKRCCEYLTKAWQPWLPHGWRVDLPSDKEWEKAARGGDRIPLAPKLNQLDQLASALCTAIKFKDNPAPDREFPWGNIFENEKANTHESAINEINAVGCFQMSVGPYGCEEMGGNVWEWSANSWTKQKSKHFDMEARFMRGGSQSSPSDYARCSFRYGVLSDVLLSDLGFRLVLRPPATSEL